jgi:hypothetical protein
MPTLHASPKKALPFIVQSMPQQAEKWIAPAFAKASADK